MTRRNRALTRLASALFALLAVSELIETVRLSDISNLAARIWTQRWDGMQIVQPIVLVTGLAIVALAIVSCTLGLRLASKGDVNVRRLSNHAQVCAICLVGLAFADCIVDASVAQAGFCNFLLALVASPMFMATTEQLERSLSCVSRRTDVDLAPLPDYLSVPYTEFSVSPRTGFLVAAKEGEPIVVRIESSLDRLDDLPPALGAQAAEAIATPSHCFCLGVDDLVVGGVLIPVVGLRAAHLDAKRPISFSYMLRDGVLTLMTDSDEARSLLAMYLVDQFVSKRDAVTGLVELFMLLISKASAWIDGYGRWLTEQEDRLADDVRELPRDFTEFVTTARRELAQLARFYRQAGELFSDLSKNKARAGWQDETREAMSVISIRLQRLSDDALELQNRIAEMREGYQDRVDVRQNGVISMLTIVTTVFTPLSIVTGWYGMNFQNMPELHNPDAYFVTIVVLALVVTAEFAFFKYRRWF